MSDPARDVSASHEEAAARLEHIAPGYLDQVRRAAGDLSVPSTTEARMARSLDMVGETAHVDANVPTGSSRLVARVVKKIVALLIRWYMVYLADQVADLGYSVSWMGRALQEYIAGLESEVADLRTEVADLRARVDGIDAAK